MAEAPDVRLIDGTARTVRELFTGRKYGLDYYQREYTWTEANAAELLNDLASSFLREHEPSDERQDVASYRPYFLGPIVTSLVGGTRYLVDGQQRLTTLTLLLIHLNHLGSTLEDWVNLSPLVFSQQFGAKTFNINVEERNQVMHAILSDKQFDPSGASDSIANIWAQYQNLVDLFPEDLKNGALPYFVDWLLDRVVLVEIGTTDQDMALEIFEAMNDRGLRLSNTDMLKGYLLARIRDAKEIDESNRHWRQRISTLTDIDKNADSDFVKAWLRGKYADTIRERKRDAAPGDFDLIGTAFHKWVRDNSAFIGLEKASDFNRFVNHDFMRMSQRYMTLLRVSASFEPGWEHLYYNATTGLTLQYLPIMAAVTPDDDDETFRSKARMVASYLDLFVARRMVNFRNFGYSTIVYTMFNLTKDIRNRDLDKLREVLADRIADLPENFDGVMSLRLTQRNRTHIHYLLARMTSWIENQCGKPANFATYVDRQQKKPFEVEHIWADKFDRHLDEFSNTHDFAEYRNRIGDLVLLPKDFNASYGDKPYGAKLPHYHGQNLLAASLNPLTYEHNPSFLNFINASGLPFKPYPDGFKKSDLEERQELYRQICEQVWHPDALGLGGGVPSEETTQTKRKATYGVGVNDLLEAGLVAPHEPLVGERNGIRYKAVITPSGQVRVEDGRVFETLSGASDTLTGTSNNGWEFWRVNRPEGQVELARIRSAFISRQQD